MDTDTVNALTGVILVNGLPPSQLPSSITDDLLYKKVFGTNNFEVIKKDGFFETVSPEDGFFYRFYRVHSSLVVQESQYVDERIIRIHPTFGCLKALFALCFS